MDKITTSAPDRLYLIEKLPEPLTPASEHLQLFDNYIAGTRMRIRQVRDPKTKEWTRLLQQRVTEASDGAAAQHYNALELNDAEYAVFERFEEREIRKNRYFLEADGVRYVFDIHLGTLWGINIVHISFADPDTARGFAGPPHAIHEISNDELFIGENLVAADLESIRRHLSLNARPVGKTS